MKDVCCTICCKRAPQSGMACVQHGCVEARGPVEPVLQQVLKHLRSRTLVALRLAKSETSSSSALAAHRPQLT